MKISIIVPVYNIAEYLSYCVESLVCQDHQDLEIILVNDGSKDKSPEICDGWAKRDARIKVVHKPNGGLSDARNAGLDAATGEYVLFIDGDDYLANGALSALAAIAEENPVDVVQFGYEEVSGYAGLEDALKANTERVSRSLESRYTVRDRGEMFRNLYALGGVAASACTKFMRLETARKLRFKKGLLHEDEQFTTRLLVQAKGVCYVNDFLPYKYVMREGSIIHAAFKAKKLYDLAAIYEERISVLRQAGLEEWAPPTASRYFNALVLLYGQAREAGNKEACAFINQKAKFLLSHHKLQLSGRNKALAYLYKAGMPATEIYYGIRKALRK